LRIGLESGGGRTEVSALLGKRFRGGVAGITGRDVSGWKVGDRSSEEGGVPDEVLRPGRGRQEMNAERRFTSEHSRCVSASDSVHVRRGIGI